MWDGWDLPPQDNPHTITPPPPTATPVLCELRTEKSPLFTKDQINEMYRLGPVNSDKLSSVASGTRPPGGLELKLISGV